MSNIFSFKCPETKDTDLIRSFFKSVRVFVLNSVWYGSSKLPAYVCMYLMKTVTTEHSFPAVDGVAPPINKVIILSIFYIFFNMAVLLMLWWMICGRIKSILSLTKVYQSKSENGMRQRKTEPLYLYPYKLHRIFVFTRCHLLSSLGDLQLC